MKASGRMTSSMVTAWKHGQTKLATKAPTSMEQSMERAPFAGRMAPATLASSNITISVDTANINGAMVVIMTVSGRRIKCMAMVYSGGMMAASTKANL